MTHETQKSNERRKTQPLFQRIFRGKGIDIGCGEDILNRDGCFPAVVSCEPYDREQGDAEQVARPRESYDFVYSSNCLEHLRDPQEALINWFDLVKRGGHLVITVPDEDLYEQRIWPSRWNHEHKWTFTVYKPQSWSPKSLNMIDLIRPLDGQVLRLDLIDTNYDYTKVDIDQTMPPINAEAFIELVMRKL